MDDKEYFNPGIVDEQVDALLQTSDPAEKEQRTVHDLQEIYQSDLQSLERVWKSLNLGTDTGFGERPWLDNISHTDTSSPYYERSRSMQGQHTQRDKTSARLALTRRFSLIAAVLVGALLVGSLIAFLNISHPPQGSASVPNNPQAKTPAGLYLSYDNGVSKYDAKTGKTVWRYDAASIKGSPQKIVSTGNAVFVLMSNELKDSVASSMVALNAQNGSVLWQKKLTIPGGSDMVVEDGNAYVVSTDGTHFKSEIDVFETSTGTKKASYPLSLVINAIIVDTGKLYLGTDQGLYVVNAQNGKVIWKDQVAGSSKPYMPYRVVTHIVNKVVYAAFQGPNTSYFKAYNAQSGVKLWQSKAIDGQIPDFTISGQQLYTSVTQPFGIVSNTIYAYNIQNGKLNWSVSMPDHIGSEPTSNKGVVYVYTYAGKQTGKKDMLNAFNESTGKRLWQKPVIGGQFSLSSVVMGSDLIYVMNADAAAPSSHRRTHVDAYNLNGTQIWDMTIDKYVISLVFKS
ncbi:hypothetical protein KDW_23770 [Dictyobacter vulcani]|uniref:Pyrrolo-quinoline quinone repeat domain-containing protein n=2 Tax=Dictyobacter vulcani TaxID=2607529 RepID=A0A5J4KK62_9CHLR|nr:hypothetical protein KDW_23770 [Dictyobacter vulcani]